jgi:hypothetical protein
MQMAPTYDDPLQTHGLWQMIAYGSVLTLMFWMLVGHAIADFALQTHELSSTKRRTSAGEMPWQVALTAHSIIHSGFVALITGSVFLGTLELLAHSAIDFAKCEGFLGRGRRAMWVDQLLHVACKVTWISLIAAGVA